MLNFNTTVQEIIATQVKATSKGLFKEYASKKKLLEANVLTEAQANYVKQLKNAYVFNLHIDGEYLIITFYFTNKPEVMVMELATFKCAKAENITKAKKGVLELMANKAAAKAEEVTSEEKVQATKAEAIKELAVEKASKKTVK